MKPHFFQHTVAAALAASSLLASSASAQWVNYVNQTSSRVIASPSLLVNDNLEKDFEIADFDRDGDQDLICVRKFPGSIQGGFRNILFMNEGGVLVDRTVEYGSAADVAGSQGFLDPTNDRDVKAVDVDNDGWLDLVTATTMSDHVSPMLGQPRVYRNLGNDANGNWLGFRFEDGRIPTMFALSGAAANPRFCDMAVGDFNGDGFVDLFYTDYDTPETSGTICIDLNADGDTNDPGECQQSPGETPTLDYNNKLLYNLGAANPGFFADTLNTRMTPAQLDSAFGNAAAAVDLNGDGKLDIVRINTLTGGQNVATIYSRPDGLGNSFLGPDQAVAGAPYNMDAGDINGDGRIDLLIVDDGQDKVLINSGNGADGFADFTSYTIADSLGEFGNTARLVDLNNDGRLDAIICDVDSDLGPFCPSSGRRTKIYYNTGVVGPNLLDEQGTVLPIANLSSVFDIAPIDINGDGWLDLVVGRCGGIDVFINQPPIFVTFNYPNGRPSTLAPGTPTPMTVNTAITGGGSIVAGSAKLHVSTNGGTSFTAIPMAPVSATSFTATFPAFSCTDSVRYYVAAELSNGGLTLDPPSAPGQSFALDVLSSSEEAVNESFEGSTSAWSVTNSSTLTAGAWVAGVPVPTSLSGNFASPQTDATPGAGTRCFMTGLGSPGGAAGSQDVDGGTTTLTSPSFDLSGASSALASMAVWYYCDDIVSNNTAQADYLRIEVSNGGPWVLLEEVRAITTAWTTKSYNLADFVTLTADVRIRFIASDLLNNSVTEAAIDDFVVRVGSCVENNCPADLDGDGTVGSPDLAALLSAWGSGKIDLDGDGVAGSSDLAAMLSAWGGCP